MKHPISPEEAVAGIPDGASIMIGGFLRCGRPQRLIEALLASGKKNLTIISNDTGFAGEGIGALISSGQVARVVASHIGTNPDTQKGLIEKTMQVDLVPQGTLVEQIRAKGHGLGGVLTKTGLGTIVADEAEVLTLNGEQWLYAPPLAADFGFVYADRADMVGNLAYTLTELNFNPAIAMAADTVFAEARVIVPVGAITPDDVRTPGIVIDHLIARA
ncbi:MULTISPECIES: CoA transferase subunit A [unclassified Novosphingobium]|uniref:CoA transferase subunit A n=1 Tax=unclassified Novosphingobium TaxID=2644732 RepID=UPI000868A422|nr:MULTISPECIES: 3-oxoacid CoA-transferase subunit A [unclassified Novosphingobium]MBN9144394.1 3-oxoacid CoA-transferase subunit A [Novosphingobium sp.]MDR6707718.1 acetate CoA/acetoacetate CoA-transferase alpha subunit [Novosphingobium sp. 1748]ODU83961.1 MAG: acetyl-CoA--acetoacetyl-CoA transferase subunit alpha [Novosphingobium sp. SCN 63-17]OJX93513.1 MAG: acetyl-CoA--acetoacetyl-CoA transferase subunit alpha [Novosphingobium sp. 63-713]